MSPHHDFNFALPEQQWTNEPIRAVVTGSSGGIGSAIVSALLSADESKVAKVFTVDRSSAKSCAFPNERRLIRLETDFADPASYQRLATRIHEHTSQINLVINCIGLLHSEDVRPEKSLRQVALPQLHALFAANAFPVLLLAQALESLLKHKGTSVFASLSARVGSLADNRTGGWYGYRASKAAHNMFLKTLALEWGVKLPHCVCVALHPGTVNTSLSKPFVTANYQKTLHSPESAAGHLLARIGELRPVDSGQFIAWNGERLPW
ncbi:SDR family NAD(P)-dependent oxidoreductase [Allohahella sp. A8]|mgnify:CR=1 FL=1|uniref:SDR family NAD(P)-dependent oxidoreductase n=1 Tax=Allohahella sp. A8 TaxID=3141461 RepID=UPI0026B59FDE|tara:strand:- start:4842 stop:5636 length:795 start_codon:yes stop_codon:yes gene_type:complete